MLIISIVNHLIWFQELFLLFRTWALRWAVFFINSFSRKLASLLFFSGEHKPLSKHNWIKYIRDLGCVVRWFHLLCLGHESSLLLSQIMLFFLVCTLCFFKFNKQFLLFDDLLLIFTDFIHNLIQFFLNLQKLSPNFSWRNFWFK